MDERKKVYSEFPNLLGSAKPKTHYLSHYPQAVRLYGPPLSYWTARYESRHRIAKNTAEVSKNFKNISKTISTRQQLRLSSVYYHGMFETSDLIMTKKATYKRGLLGKTDVERSVLPYMDEQDFLCSGILIKSQLYESGDLVVLEVFNSDEIKVGLILSVLVKENSAYFITKQYIATRRELQYFEGNSEDSILALNDSTKIVDFKPLINYGTTSHIFFCLHHHLSFSYT